MKNTLLEEKLKPNRKSRKITQLKQTLEGRVAVYALTAAAAGVGLLATSIPADAGGFTIPLAPTFIAYNPADIPVPSFGVGFTYVSGMINQRTANGPLFFYTTIKGALGVDANGELVIPGPKGLVGTSGRAIYNYGEAYFRHVVGSGGIHFPGSHIIRETAALLIKSFGFEVNVQGNEYFGWVKFDQEPPAVASLAIQSSPGMPIGLGQLPDPATPEPGTLSLLALGALGLLALRKRLAAQRS